MRKVLLALAFCGAFLAMGGLLDGLRGFAMSHTGLAEAAEDTVLFNTKTHIFHGPGCPAGRACTVNCVPMPRSQAMKRGRPCGRCGGM